MGFQDSDFLAHVAYRAGSEPHGEGWRAWDAYSFAGVMRTCVVGTGATARDAHAAAMSKVTDEGGRVFYPR